MYGARGGHGGKGGRADRSAASGATMDGTLTSEEATVALGEVGLTIVVIVG